MVKKSSRTSQAKAGSGKADQSKEQKDEVTASNSAEGDGPKTGKIKLPEDSDDELPKKRLTEEEKWELKKIRINIETPDGKTVNMRLPRYTTISELKGILCWEHGFVPSRHVLYDHNGGPLDDVLTLGQCNIKADEMLQLHNPWQAVTTRKPTKAQLAEQVENDELAREEAARKAFKVSDEELKSAVKGCLKKAMTSGGMHVKESLSERKIARENLKARLKEMSSSNESEEAHEPTDLVSLMAGAVQSFFPSMFVKCTQAPVKKPSRGGA